MYRAQVRANPISGHGCHGIPKSRHAATAAVRVFGLRQSSSKDPAGIRHRRIQRGLSRWSLPLRLRSMSLFRMPGFGDHTEALFTNSGEFSLK
jgi:hypothetical protein